MRGKMKRSLLLGLLAALVLSLAPSTYAARETQTNSFDHAVMIQMPVSEVWHAGQPPEIPAYNEHWWQAQTASMCMSNWPAASTWSSMQWSPYTVELQSSGTSFAWFGAICTIYDGLDLLKIRVNIFVGPPSLDPADLKATVTGNWTCIYGTGKWANKTSASKGSISGTFKYVNLCCDANDPYNTLHMNIPSGLSTGYGGNPSNVTNFFLRFKGIMVNNAP
jgi:hypothetical protein